MNTVTAPKTKNKISSNLLQSIFKELQIIRKELSLIIPQEDIKEYAHSARIKKSYQRALKRFPISSSL